MEQSSAAAIAETQPEPLAVIGPSAARSVYRGIMRALESHHLAPGQRLVETDLAAQFGVGRNAVREALQWLGAQGVIAAIRHRSSAVRRLDPAEALEVLDVAEAMIVLAAGGAAQRFRADEHGAALETALQELERADDDADPGTFDRARRRFFGVLLEIGGNRELARLFPAVALHILFAQRRGAALRRHRLDDYRAMRTAVAAGDSDGADAAGRAHADAMREIVRSQAATWS